MTTNNNIEQALSPFETFINGEYGVIGRTVSTKSEPNTSSQFQFWVANKEAKISLEIGNIVSAYADSQADITLVQLLKCGHIAMWTASLLTI
jgi:hypothetical protein